MADDDDKAAWVPDSPAEAVERIRALETDLAAARDEACQSNDRWLRERADLENLKKRAARERDETVRFANEKVLRDLLPVVDNLERAVQHAPEGPLVEGVGLVLKTLLDVLQRHGVMRVAAQGAPFDPAHHEAMAQRETSEQAPNSVLEEHQPGYRLHDRLLRPALVTVARAPGNLANVKPRD